MGGGVYDGDVARRARSTNRDAFSYQGYSSGSSSESSARGVNELLNPYGPQFREVNNETPIVVAMDVTRSRGDDSRIMYDKLPMFIGQIELNNYVPDPGVSFAAIGDATVDCAPLQVGQFEGDNRLDAVLEAFWLEEGGGGTGQESYELAAWFYAQTNTVRLLKGEGHKGYFFFVGDEGFYPQVDHLAVRRIIGADLDAPVPSDEAFRQLQEKFDVFFVYPKKSFEDRKADIDAEIKTRVQAAGGQYDGVDIRASLIWNNRNDLDLHLIAPSGHHIYYGDKRSACGGWLDVDMNVSGDSQKPVENIRWAKGQAHKGRYKVFVRNYGFHESKKAPTEFRVELEVAGKIQHFDGVISKKKETGGKSDITVYEFDYDPAANADIEERDDYAQYDDEVILGQWGSVIPREHILPIESPEAIVDVMLGALGIRHGSADLREYTEHMKQRGAGETRIAQVTNALASLSSRGASASIEGDVPTAGPPRRKRTQRL
jgi:hypothetical protein